MNLQEAIEKAAKLLRLATSPNVNEAALAAAKAQEIIDKYRLDVNDIDFDANTKREDSEPVKDFGYNDPLDAPDAKQFAKEMISLANLISYHNQTYVSYRKLSTYHIEIRIVGRPADVQTTRYLYGFYKLQVLEMVKRMCVGNSPTYKGQFIMGVIDAIREKLRVQFDLTVKSARDSAADNSLALVRVNKAVSRLEDRRKEVILFEVDRRNKELKAAADRTGMTPKQYMKWRGTGHGYNGPRTETGGRAEGRVAGQSIRTTRAAGSLGSSRKEIV